MRSGIYVGPARSVSELQAARRLAASTFRVNPSQTAAEVEDYKAFLWGEPEFPGISHVIVASTGDAVRGAVRLLPRSVLRSGERFRAAGISSVCVAETHRGAGLSRELMDATLAQARALAYEITVLFARRAVDHFYPRHDIWGLASYSKLSIAPATSPVPTGGPAVSLRALGPGDHDRVSRWHEQSYAACFGPMARSASRWRFLAEQAAYRGFRLVVAEEGTVPIGYAVLEGEHVVEIGHEPGTAQAFLSALRKNGGPLVVDVPLRHTLRDELDGLDITSSERRCEYGGHMLGVLDRDGVSRRLERRVEARAAAFGLAPRVERMDSLTIRWDGQRAAVELTPRADRALGLKATARLVGCHIGTLAEASLLGPGEPLDFLSMDQF